MIKDERIVALDILRGMALFGMIVVHFHQKLEASAKGVEDLIGWIIWVGIESKAWAAFAFLFGASFGIFLRRAEARGLNVVPLFLRRMLMLAGYGVLVKFLLDFTILIDYAFWGTLLLFIRKWPARALLVVAVLAALWTKSYSMIHTPASNFVLIILGFLSIREGVLENPRKHLRLITGVMIFGFVSWAIWWLYLWNLEHDVGFGIIRDQWLGLTYVGAGLLILEYWPAWKARLSGTGFAGRMALTNYVLQAAFFWFVAVVINLKVRPYYDFPGAILLFGVLVLFSKFWLARHRYGPLERLWRSFTYWRLDTTS
jgi:uncharacterized membrane protein YeiB